MDIRYYRKMKNIERLSGTFHIRPYNLLEHSYMVGMLFINFAKLEGVEYNEKTLETVFNHDILEAETGDLIYTVKNHNDNTKFAWRTIEQEVINSNPDLAPYSDYEMECSLTKEQYDLFKVCDLLDLWIFLKEEQKFGNKSEEVETIIKKCDYIIGGKYKHVLKYMSKNAR